MYSFWWHWELNPGPGGGALLLSFIPVLFLLLILGEGPDKQSRQTLKLRHSFAGVGAPILQDAKMDCKLAAL